MFFDLDWFDGISKGDVLVVLFDGDLVFVFGSEFGADDLGVIETIILKTSVYRKIIFNKGKKVEKEERV